jgi:phosphoglycolate phosphatase-like HAD superfamily hydrolase
MSRPASWIVLFDIDGTLVLTGRAGLRGMTCAFSRLYGSTAALEGIRDNAHRRNPVPGQQRNDC